MKPNGALRWLLTRVSSRAAADATIGDLLEELDARRTVGARVNAPRAWLNLRMVVALGAAVASTMPTTWRTAGLTLRDAWRSLRRAPASTAVILIVLGVAISAATVTFSVVDAVVLRPLPFDHSERIVMISGYRLGGPTGITVAQYEAIRRQVRGLDSVGVLWLGNDSTVVTIDGTTANVGVARATSEAFQVLRLSPVVGRVWSADDEAHRRDDLAVISARLWRGRFGGGPAVIGKVIGVFGRSHDIVGVLPDRATSVGDDRFSQDVWVPATAQIAFQASRPASTFSVIARLKPGGSIEGVAREIVAATAAIPPPNPAFKNWHPVVERWDARLIGDARGWLLLLLAAVGFVLLIACVNVANVMLTQSAERARDLAVRASFGASRRQLAASVLAEGLILSLAASAAALLFALWGVGAAKAALPQAVAIFREHAIAVNARVVAAGGLAALVTGLLLGSVPAWQASRTSVVALLKDAGAGATPRRGWRSAFLVAEVGSIGVLLVVSTLFITSFARVMTLDLGFDQSHLIAVSRNNGYTGSVAELEARLQPLPGVTGVAAAGPSSLPLVGSAFGGVWMDSPLVPVGDVGDAHEVDAEVYRVTPNFFAVAGVKFLRGSTWAAGTPPAPLPMVVDEVAAGQLFGTHDPIGQVVRAHDLKDAEFTIVGVVPFAYSHGPDRSERPSAYYAMAPSDPPGAAGFLVRTSASPEALAQSVEAVVASVEPKSAGRPEVFVVDEAFRRLTETRRFNAVLMSALALFALFIGAAGMYAVMSSIVAQQTREIGVRVALGATTGDIRRGVLARAARHVLAGLALGLPAGWLISRGFASQFFQVRPTDASIYVIVAATVGVVAIVAAFVPARRAANVDPVVSLRAS